MIPDTSAWVELLRGTGSRLDRAMTQLLEERAPIAVTEVVVMELLAGARSDMQASSLRRLLLGFPLLRLEGLAGFEHAAAISRACRVAGDPVRHTIDCLIAAVAIREGASVLHADRDFDAIARHSALRIEPLRS